MEITKLFAGLNCRFRIRERELYLLFIMNFATNYLKRVVMCVIVFVLSLFVYKY